jgi:choline dehydrogenase-like flavoprotein
MNYDLVVCGTGFASTFFLKKWLDKRPKDRVLVLERGQDHPYADLLARHGALATKPEDFYQSKGQSDKTWLFTIGMGGSSACWWGQTPRMLPEDFKLRSRYGVGFDWPIGYDDLEPFYEEAEDLIVVSGPDVTPYPRRRPYPQPANTVADFDRDMMRKYPGLWIATPTARSSQGTANRGKCCANGVCNLCPVDAKFRIMNEMAHVYKDNANVEVIVGAEVREIDIQAGAAKGVAWRAGGKDYRAGASLVFMGMNAMFNPNVLLRSGDTSPLTGRRLYEQISKHIIVDLANVKGYNGGTHITGIGYHFYAGEHRRRRGAVLIEHTNAPALLRHEEGKWQSSVMLKIVAENIPLDDNRVEMGEKPTAVYAGPTDYGVRALNEVPDELVKLLATISPVEAVHMRHGLNPSEGHIQGTTVMSQRPEDGVVDHLLRHHRIANLVVGGSGAFPSGPPSNPSLTIAALSLRSAANIA